VTERRDRVAVALRVNGRAYEREVEPRTTLADLIRDHLDLTGTHLGCEHGVCGACTVLIDGSSARACLVLAARADGREVTTIEGLGVDGGLGVDALGPLQRGCWERHSFQCGFCTPGMLIAATELLAARPDPTEREVRDALSGNLCRCTGYDSIVAGVLRGAELLRQAGGPDEAP
jgi:carbon-monoxide dehydrogenase small subunit